MADLSQFIFTREGTAPTLAEGVLGYVATCVRCGALCWKEMEPAVRRWSVEHKCPREKRAAQGG